MHSDREPVYRFSIGRLLRTVRYDLFSIDWMKATFLFLLSIFFYAVWEIINQKYPIDNDLFSVLNPLVGSLVPLSAGYLGYLGAKHRYIPSKSGRAITGNFALMIGTILMIVFWGLAAYLLFSSVSNLIELI